MVNLNQHNHNDEDEDKLSRWRHHWRTHVEVNPMIKHYKGRPLRILCLHGTEVSSGSTGEAFEKQLDELQTQCSKYLCEFVCPPAPHKRYDISVREARGDYRAAARQRVWMAGGSESNISEQAAAADYTGAGGGGAGDIVQKQWVDTYAFLKKFIEVNGPFDGILGFGTGATT